LTYAISITQEIEIVAASGILIDRSKRIIRAEERSVELDASQLKKGLNLIRVIDSDGKITTIKVITQ
jgi:hypothetical protein